MELHITIVDRNMNYRILIAIWICLILNVLI